MPPVVFNTLDRMFNARYELGDLDYKKNIKFVKSNWLLWHRFEKALILDYGTIRAINGLIQADEITVISELYSEDPAYFLSKDLYNVTYFGEMPFVYKDVSYELGFLLKRYKEVKDTLGGVFFNIPSNALPSPKGQPECNRSITHEYRLKKAKELGYEDVIIKPTDMHISNLFSLFDTYIYYHARGAFDARPRLFVECYHYGKNIQYINPDKIQDGSWYRYKDVMDNGIKHRELTKDDAIVRRFV